MQKEKILIALSAITALIGLYFDGWWHVIIGREQFLTPPHIVLYVGIGALVCMLIKIRKRVPKITWVLITILALAVPLDNWWHQVFGAESSTSIWVVWSPPHLVGQVAIAGLLLVAAALVNQPQKGKKKNQKELFPFVLIWAAFSSIVLFLLGPLYSIGPHHLLGIYGQLIILFALALIIKEYYRRGGTSLTVLTIPTIIIGLPLGFAVGQTETPFYATLSLVPFLFVSLAPAIITDLTTRKVTPSTSKHLSRCCCIPFSMWEGTSFFWRPIAPIGQSLSGGWLPQSRSHG